MSVIKNIIINQLWTLVYEEETKIIHLKQYFEYADMGTIHKIIFFDNEDDMNDKIKELNILTLEEYIEKNEYLNG
jgi:hypothetical protein